MCSEAAGCGGHRIAAALPRCCGSHRQKRTAASSSLATRPHSRSKLPNRPFAGEVTQIRPFPQTYEHVATYDVVINAPNPDRLLVPGMKATIGVVIDKRDDVLRAPNRALRYSPRDLAFPNGSARRWIASPREIASQPGKLCEVEGERAAFATSIAGIAHKSVKQDDFGIRQRD